jgi:hypothetical protein
MRRLLAISYSMPLDSKNPLKSSLTIRCTIASSLSSVRFLQLSLQLRYKGCLQL